MKKFHSMLQTFKVKFVSMILMAAAFFATTAAHAIHDDQDFLDLSGDPFTEGDPYGSPFEDGDPDLGPTTLTMPSFVTAGDPYEMGGPVNRRVQGARAVLAAGGSKQEAVKAFLHPN